PSVSTFFFPCCGDPRYLHSFPTRRSSDLDEAAPDLHHEAADPRQLAAAHGRPRRCASITRISSGMPRPVTAETATSGRPRRSHRDRKSTRLNSSHVAISYAVFCLKKKKHL